MATQHASIGGPAVGDLWRALCRGYERLEATERGYVYLSKLGPAILFGLVAVLKAWSVCRLIEFAVTGGADLKLGLAIGYQFSGFCFFGLVTALYLLRRRPLKRVAGAWQGAAALIGSYVMLPVAVGGAHTDSIPVLFAAQILLMVGTAGAALAMASLGRCFGIFPEARGLVTHGLYRFVRHPMYLFEFIAFLGVLLPAFTPLNAMLYLVFVFMQLSRMTFEERVLESTFPETYPDYRQRTARLIPGLY